MNNAPGTRFKICWGREPGAARGTATGLPPKFRSLDDGGPSLLIVLIVFLAPSPVSSCSVCYFALLSDFCTHISATLCLFSFCSPQLSVSSRLCVHPLDVPTIQLSQHN